VRLHGEPLGVVDFDVRGGEDAAEGALARVRGDLWETVRRHLREDAAPSAVDDPLLTSEGLAGVPPTCPRTRPRAEISATIIICTRDRADEFGRALDSVLGLNYRDYEVVVVDSAPTTTETRDVVAARASSGVAIRYFRDDVPALSRARNRGVAEAAGEVVAFTDDDVRVVRERLAELVAAFDAGEDVVCTTGLSLAAELETQAQVWFEEFGGFGKGFERRVFHARSPSRARALRAQGGLDEHLGAGTRVGGGEDLDAFIRVIVNGHRLVYEPRAVVWHFHRRDLAALERQIRAAGVGLSAAVVKLLGEERTRKDVLTRLGPGIRYLFSSPHRKTTRKSSAYPRALSRAELADLVCGPFIYAYSRVVDRRRPVTTLSDPQPGD
jgi:glycosyltransferase involved in cell wall biosynthesis